MYRVPRRAHSDQESFPLVCSAVAGAHGLIEHRDATLDDGFTRLLAVAPSLAARPVSELCEEILERKAPDLTDDFALLALPVRDVEPPGT